MSMARRCAALGLFLLASPTASAQEASKCLRDGCGVAAPGGSEEQALLQLRQEEKQCAGGGSPYHDNARRKRLKKIWRGKRCPFGNGHPDLEPEEEKKCVDMKQLKEVAQGMIELMMESMQDPGPPAEWPAVCEMSNKEKCPLSKMGGKRHMIKPGGKTTCLDSEYAFLVEPGDSDKLLIYFQGGGLCLNALTYTLGTCNKDLHGAYDFSGPGHHMGFFNRSNPHDPLRNHTSITLHYCSGDMHLGDKEHHTWSKNGTVKQAGFLNAMAGIRWALDNMPNKLSSLVISGESAGAIGTQVWADYLLSNRMLFTLGKKFNYHHAAVIVDSGVGVLPEGAIDMTLGMYGTCNLPVLSHPHQMACSHGTLSNNHVIMDAMARHPSVQFGFIESKTDIVQRSFWDLLYVFTHKKIKFIGPDMFYEETMQWLKDYAKMFPNFSVMLVTGSTHTFIYKTDFYSAGTLGIVAGSPPEHPTMWKWVTDLVKCKHAPRVCHGEDCPPALEANAALPN